MHINAWAQYKRRAQKLQLISVTHSMHLLRYHFTHARSLTMRCVGYSIKYLNESAIHHCV